METIAAALEQAFSDYRKEVEECRRRLKPADGLFGIGHSLKDDACNDRFDRRVEQLVAAACALPPMPEEAERLARRLLLPQDTQPWPLAAEWMLRAAERHALPLIPFLDKAGAAALLKEYAARYRPWDRLPAQKQVCRALKERA